MPRPSFDAFTVKGNGELNRIITDISICSAFDPDAPPTPLPTSKPAKALWDTGATRSVISKEIAKELGLAPVGTVNVTHGGGVGSSPTYLVNLALPHGVAFAGILVTEFPPPSDDSFTVIVGMDIICAGDFALTNVGGRTWLSFRVPSCGSIDYVVEWNRLMFAGTHRNAPCPCGSGEKFKRCHGA